MRRSLGILAVLTAALPLVGGAALPGGVDASLSDAPSRFATLDGSRVHYKVLGAGSPALVFVHGWTCDMTVWRLQAPVLAQDHHVVFVDLPGHGRSDAPDVAYTMSLFARAVEAAMREAGVSRAV